MGTASRIRGSGALATSVALHALTLGAGALLLSRSLAQRRPSRAVPHSVEVTLTGTHIDLPRMAMGGSASARPQPREPDHQKVVAELGGGHRVPRPDMRRAGHGGTDQVSQRALNLADSNDGLTLDRDLLNRPHLSQVQRLHTGRDRRSLDDRRATPHPMQLTFLATGAGDTPLRRPSARLDPSLGIRTGDRARSQGGVPGSADTPSAGRGRMLEPGAAEAGGRERELAQGTPTGAQGHDHRMSASVMLARPMVRRARAAVPAPVRGRPADNVNSSQAVASRVASLIQASTAGGQPGVGPGGQDGPGPSGNKGSSGAGSRSAAAGNGAGPLLDVGRDPRALGYFRSIKARVDPYWKKAFPDWAIAEGRGGLAVVAFTVLHNGSVVHVHLVRRSGVDEFDQNVLRAVRLAGPFGKPPAILGRGPIALKLVFDAVNSPVGRRGPGPGRWR